jgi:ATP-dependent DNA helicase RecQ
VEQAAPQDGQGFSRGAVYHLLRAGFGLEEFRLGQADVVRAIGMGRPAIAVMPTGGGKSLCYQLPAALLPGTSLVISPLISLMRDQVLALRARGYAAGHLDSTQDMDERRAVEEALVQGRLKLLYVSPERLQAPRFLELLEQVEVPFVAIDEAHCVLRWGHEFREAYLQILPFLERLQPPRVAAFTATATPELREELGEALGMRGPELFVHGFFRPNLHLEDAKMANEEGQLRHLAGLVQGRSGKAPALIYAATRQKTEDAAAALEAAGLRAAHYHAGMEGEARTRVQDAFLADELDALVATSAFGMGIDKPDLRLLVHLSMPRSFEDYYQEIGRAGRDGGEARVVLLWLGKDYRTQDFLIQQNEDPVQRAAGQRRLHRVYEALQSNLCLWRRLLEYFGDPDVAAVVPSCGSCARCEAAGSSSRALEPAEEQLARTMLSAAAAQEAQRRPFGRRKFVDILRGSQAKGVPTHAPGYGQAREVSRPAAEAMLQALIDAGLLVTCGSEYPVLGLGPRASEVLQGLEELELPLAETMVAPPRPARSRGGEAPEIAMLGDEEGLLFERLRQWRAAQAKAAGAPPYVVASNKALLAVVEAQPATEDELLEVPGFGPKKVSRFGASLLAALRGDEEALLDDLHADA